MLRHRFRTTLLMRLWLVSIAALMLTEYVHAASLVPHGIDSFFTTANESNEVQCRVVGGDLSAPIQYVVRDYWEMPVAEGHVEPTKDGLVSIHLSLEQGFFEVEFPATEQRFGVVASPAFWGKPDAFFCIDSAMSWLVKDDGHAWD
jgi:hypothetical protein